MVDPLLTAAAEERGATGRARARRRARPAIGRRRPLGATTTDQLRRNLAALDLDYAEELDHRLMPLSEKPAEYWSTRAGLAWN
jgi:hypothetical protein